MSLEAAGKISRIRLHAGRFALRLESIAVLALLILILSVLSPYFLSVSNFLNILLATSVIGVLGFGATFVIAAAGIDLSLGSVLALAGVVGALGLNSLGLPWPFAIVLCLATGAFCGLINGLLNTRAGIPAFIVTLGMLGVARGAALVLTNGLPVYGLDETIVYLGQGRPAGIPTPVIIFLLVAVVAHFVLAYTRFGKYALIIGDNEGAARAMGVRVERQRILLYVLSGTLAGLAGLLFIARVNAGDPTAGINYELTAITAAILGGTNLFGGRASVIGTLIGALIMGVLQNGLNLLAVSSFYQQMAIGAVLVLAVWLDQVNRSRSQR
ncbi:MAG: ribose transport system permease protein [Rhodospirillaceae bacterium]|jgi:ribose/xylose/arabinose/galactoside ABC-type transport system permease subunit|nr:ribose transport system permease protein [Rhodospirillaceae bacterium]